MQTKLIKLDIKIQYLRALLHLLINNNSINEDIVLRCSRTLNALINDYEYEKQNSISQLKKTYNY